MTDQERIKEAHRAGYTTSYEHLEAWAKANPNFTFGDLRKEAMRELTVSREEPAPFAYKESPQLEDVWRCARFRAINETFAIQKSAAIQHEEKETPRATPERIKAAYAGLGY